MVNKPAENPDWAESADPSDVDEPDLLRPEGYTRGQDLSWAELNWHFKMVGRWLRWLESLSVPYETVQEALAGSSVGDTVWVKDIEAYIDPLSRQQPLAWKDVDGDYDAADTAYDAAWIATDSEYLVLTNDGADENFLVVDPTDFSIDQTLTPANAGTPVKAIIASGHVIGIYGSSIEVWNASTGAAVTVIDTSSNLKDVTCDNDIVVVTGDNLGPATTYAYDLSTLIAGGTTQKWAYDEGADTVAVAILGSEVFVGRTDQVNAIHVISAVDGTFVLSIAADQITPRGMISDGNAVFFSDVAENIEKIDGSYNIVASGDRGGVMCDYDEDYILVSEYGVGVSTNEYSLLLVDKRTLYAVHEGLSNSDPGDQGNNPGIFGATDGYHVFTADPKFDRVYGDLNRRIRGTMGKAFQHTDGTSSLSLRKMIPTP